MNVLLDCDVPEVRATVAWLYARYSSSNPNISNATSDITPMIKNDLLPIIRLLAHDPDSLRTRELAQIALLNVKDTEFAETFKLASYIESINLETPKKVIETLTKESITMTMLLNPRISSEELAIFLAKNKIETRSVNAIICTH